MAVYVGMDGKPKAPTGFNEWTKKGNRVNISTGCENDCVYCYAKLIGYDQGWAVAALPLNGPMDLVERVRCD
jgi:DNA repair photolyase